MKKFLIYSLVLLSFGCQREKMNEVGVGYNKTKESIKKFFIFFCLEREY